MSLENYSVLLRSGLVPRFDREHAHPGRLDRDDRRAVYRACAHGWSCGRCKGARSARPPHDASAGLSGHHSRRGLPQHLREHAAAALRDIAFGHHRVRRCAICPTACATRIAGALQIHPDLEGQAIDFRRIAARRVFRRIVLPLLAPTLINSWLLVFLLSVQAVSLPLLLVGPGSEVMAVTLFELWQNGQVTELASMGVVWMLLMTVGQHGVPPADAPVTRSNDVEPCGLTEFRRWQRTETKPGSTTRTSSSSACSG